MVNLRDCHAHSINNGIARVANRARNVFKLGIYFACLILNSLKHTINSQLPIKHLLAKLIERNAKTVSNLAAKLWHLLNDAVEFFGSQRSASNRLAKLTQC
ncbi:hypothetical protein D3C80_1289760 [compost metagenome]